MNVDYEHVYYDYAMASNLINFLKTERNVIYLNAFHAAVASYLYNLLEFFDVDVNNFKERADAQVRSLSPRRTAIQEEKLTLKDYCEAFDLVTPLFYNWAGKIQ